MTRFWKRSVLVMGLLGNGAWAAEATASAIQRMPYVDAIGQEEGCVYVFRSKCYRSLISMLRPLVAEYRALHPEVGPSDYLEMIEYKDGVRGYRKVVSFDGKIFGSNVDLVQYLAERLLAETKTTETPATPVRPTRPELPLDKTIVQLPNENPQQGNPLVVLELHWDVLMKETGSTRNLEQEMFIQGGALKSDGERSVNLQTPHLHLVGNFGRRPNRILLAIHNTKPTENAVNADVYTFDHGWVTLLPNSGKLSTVGLAPNYRLNVGQLQEALGDAASVISVSKTLLEAVPR